MEVTEVCANKGSAPGLIGWWRWDLVSHKTMWSPEMFAIFGVDQDTFDGDVSAVHQQRVHPDDLAVVNAASEKVLLTGEPTPMEYRIVLPDGHIRTVWTQGDVHYNEAGMPVAMLGYVLEIGAYRTYRMVASARSRLLKFAQSHNLEEVLVRTLDEAEALTGSRIGFYHFVDEDEKGLTLQAWSTRTTDEFCTAEGKLSHYPIAQAGVWVDCVRTREAVVHNDYESLPHRKGMPEGHALVHREITVPVLRGGRIVAILGVGNKDTDYDDSDVGIVSMLADLAWELAEQSRTSQALRHSEARYRLLFETMGQGVVFQDGDGQIKSANPAAQRILGLTMDELLSRTSRNAEWEAVGEDGSPLDGSEHPAMVALRTGVAVHDFVMSIRTPLADDCVWLLVDSVPRFAEDGATPVEVCTTFTDITAQKRAEGEARRRSELAEGLAHATSSLLSHATLSDEDILAVLLGLGVGSDVDRAYVFEHQDGPGDSRGTFSLRYSWVKGKGARVADSPRTQGLSWDEYAPRWHDVFVTGGFIEGRVADLPEIERRALSEHDTTSVLELPIKCGDRFWGYIGFDVSSGVRSWSPGEIEVLRNAAHCIGTAMELREQAMCDPLTGLFNRRYLEDTLQREIARAIREKATTGVVCLDIDYFKEVNDRFGHAVGDQVLKGLADHLREACREGDVVCRIGGDEFLVVLPHTDLATAHECAQRWIDTARDASKAWTCVGEEITVSAGVSAIDGPESERVAITRADHALLQAKATGRNRVEVAATA